MSNHQRIREKKMAYPQCREHVIHPLYGKAEVCLVDSGYAHGRGWIHCVFGNAGGFGCYADEVVRDEQDLAQVANSRGVHG